MYSLFIQNPITGRRAWATGRHGQETSTRAWLRPTLMTDSLAQGVLRPGDCQGIRGRQPLHGRRPQGIVRQDYQGRAGGHRRPAPVAAGTVGALPWLRKPRHAAVPPPRVRPMNRPLYNWHLGRIMAYKYPESRPPRQVAWVFDTNKCIACQTCSIACKSAWTSGRGQEYMFWNNVETKPWGFYPLGWDVRLLENWGPSTGTAVPMPAKPFSKTLLMARRFPGSRCPGKTRPIPTWANTKSVSRSRPRLSSRYRTRTGCRRASGASPWPMRRH